MKKKHVPWWVWVAVAATAIIVFAMLTRTTGPEVYVMGAGAIGEVRPGDAPEGLKFRVRTQQQESIERTAARVERILSVWPETVVVAFDTSDLAPENGALTSAQTAVRELVAKASRTTVRLYLLGFVPGTDASPEAMASASVMNAWWRTEICIDERIHCVEPPPFTNDGSEARIRMVDAIERALAGERLQPRPLDPST